MRIIIVFGFIFFMMACQEKNNKQELKTYFTYNDSIESAGVKMIPIQTPIGNFKVWTKRFGNNPKIKILLLHGGPAMTHEYMECFETFFQREGFEFYEYDQLGSYYSDQPKDSSLWTTERFVEEVEQVRKAIGADASNFYVLGNSWGGILAMEYALKYQKNMKGLLVANMMASAVEYGQYADNVLAKQRRRQSVCRRRWRRLHRPHCAQHRHQDCGRAADGCVHGERRRHRPRRALGAHRAGRHRGARALQIRRPVLRLVCGALLLLHPGRGDDRFCRARPAGAVRAADQPRKRAARAAKLCLRRARQNRRAALGWQQMGQRPAEQAAAV